MPDKNTINNIIQRRYIPMIAGTEYCNNNFPTGFVSKTCDALILDITLYPPSIKIKHLLMEWS